MTRTEPALSRGAHRKRRRSGNLSTYTSIASFLSGSGSSGIAIDADDYGDQASVAMLAIARSTGKVFIGSDGNRDIASIDPGT